MSIISRNDLVFLPPGRRSSLEQAREYAAQGLAVIPCWPSTGAPYAGTSLTTDAAMIDEWFGEKWPSAKVGMAKNGHQAEPEPTPEHGAAPTVEPPQPAPTRPVEYERLDVGNLENFPGEAKTGPFWVCWRQDAPPAPDKKPPKVLVNPRSGANAKVNDPATWSDYETAVARYEQDGQLCGVGLVFSKAGLEDGPDRPANEFAGLDLDKCRDPKTSTIEPWAMELISLVDSYTEISPSLTGVKIIIKAETADRGCSFRYKDHKVEVYDHGRYFTVTGKRLPDSPAAIQDRQQIIDQLMPEPAYPRAATTVPRRTDPALDKKVDEIPDEDLVERIKRSKQGQKFAALMAGDTTGYGGGFGASGALCAILASWTRLNAERVDRLYRLSGLYESHGGRWWNGGRHPRSERIIANACARVAWLYDPTVEWPEVAALLQEFNERYYVVEDFGGKCRVCWEEADWLGKPLLKNQAFLDFRNSYMHQKVKVGEEKKRDGETVPIHETKAKAWLGHPGRRQYAQVRFAPGIDLGPETRNLWRGFAFEPRPGDCSKYLKHVEDNICRGDAALYDWLTSWMAYAVRHPAELGHVAIVLRGKKGVGKNVFAEAFNALWGRHGIVLSNEKHVVSNFNAHLLAKCSLVADEAFFAGDPRQMRLLKGLITGDNLAIEMKGVDVMMFPNHLHIIIIGNDSWLVSATGDERRFLALECGAAKREDHEYFAEIAEELNTGGYAALLHHLLYEVDLSDFNVRKAPRTDVLFDQMTESTEGAASLWLECLQSGELPAVEPNDNFYPSVKNDDGTVWLHLGSLLKFAWKRNQKQWGRVTTKQLGAVLSKGKNSMGFKPAKRTLNDLRRWEIPPLAECRALWDEKRFKVDWPDDDGEWDTGPPRPAASKRSGGRSGGDNP